MSTCTSLFHSLLNPLQPCLCRNCSSAHRLLQMHTERSISCCLVSSHIYTTRAAWVEKRQLMTHDRSRYSRSWVLMCRCWEMRSRCSAAAS